jgi:hypothetical protein
MSLLPGAGVMATDESAIGVEDRQDIALETEGVVLIHRSSGSAAGVVASGDGDQKQQYDWICVHDSITG